MKKLDKFLMQDVLYATIFTIILVQLLKLLTMNTELFDPFKLAFEDFRYTDIYFSKIKKNNNSIFPEIILVNIGKLNRAELAREIEIIDQYKPRVIGVDVFFRSPKDKTGDSLLANVLNNSHNIVLATKYEQYNTKKHTLSNLQEPFDLLNPKIQGFINIGSDYDNSSTVRYFISNVKEEHDTVFSFASRVALLYNPSIKKDILKHSSFQTILYSAISENFIILDTKDVLSRSKKLELIKDRIILMGYLGEPLLSMTDIEDKHFTPFNERISGRSIPDMNGVVINANIILMLLKGVYLHKVWGWANSLIAFILILLHVGLFIFLYKFYHIWYGASTKIIQLFSSILILFIVFYFYHYLHLDFDPAFTVIVILLSVDLIYFYEGLIKVISRRVKIKSIFNENHK